jgi:hypothetical protein
MKPRTYLPLAAMAALTLAMSSAWAGSGQQDAGRSAEALHATVAAQDGA